MIRSLHLQDTGPTRELSFEFSPRLNVLTGDNGLGKSFVLDVLWWVLTHSWVGEPAYPWRPPSGFEVTTDGLSPRLAATLPGEVADESIKLKADWQWEAQAWRRGPGRMTRSLPGFGAYEEQHDEATIRAPSLVLYARIDGSFGIWDSNQSKGRVEDDAEVAVLMTPEEVWEGKRAKPEGPGRPKTLCRGLLEDWVSWQSSGAPEFRTLCQILDLLSEPEEPLTPGQPTRVRIDDRRDIPTLELPTGVIPVTLASAGVKRILSLAYLMVWTWTEHLKTSALLNRKPTPNMVVLIDEAELHLHPRWQRSLLPSVLKGVEALSKDIRPQLFVTTHSPMVLASLESVFNDDELDDLFVLARDGSVIRSEELPFTKEGDATAWLESEVFGGVGGRSREAALAKAAAQDFMAGRLGEAEEKLEKLRVLLRSLLPAAPHRSRLALLMEPLTDKAPLAERVHAALAATLPSHDEFWVHWSLVRGAGEPTPGGDIAPR